MSETVIKVENVKKDFYLPRDKGSNSLKGKIVNIFKERDKSAETQHALRGVSFDIKKGEFFGIVGRNGSGKSTMLKMLAGIYQPTSGKITTSGKVVPFIELGVGFNPELSGRENVYLNGALLGFSRAEIDEVYDEIVDFAELHDFMEQKLKNYSSGMQVRLAFSVATHAKADILILDEILAVGDAAFQRKSSEYFKKIKQDKDTTVVFVSHSMSAVRDFCTRALLISEGEVAAVGTPEEIADKYIMESFKTESKKERDAKDDSGYELGLSERVPHLKVKPVSKQILSSNENLVFDIEYEIADDAPVHVFFAVLDELRGGSFLQNGTSPISKKGKNKVRYTLPIDYYNNSDFYVIAAIDEVGDRNRIAFTSEANSCRFAIRNKVSNDGLLRIKGGIHGHWEDGIEDYDPTKKYKP